MKNVKSKILLQPQYCFLVRQLHREFLRAGADVMQAFTFYASEDKLSNRGNKAADLGVSFVKDFYHNTQKYQRAGS